MGLKAGRQLCSEWRGLIRLPSRGRFGPPQQATLMRALKQALALLFTTAWLATASAHQDNDRATLRCGWFHNPTPQNAWLVDRDGEWTIGMQGAAQAEGDWPAFKSSQWVRTNNHHGYGCACLKLVANSESHEVSRIISAKARPLSACRNDPALQKPEA